jgi:predicted RNA binding protein YcfA (HicA-like mRNA interferase family)
LSQWPSTKAKIVRRALINKGWRVVSQRGSHVKLNHPQRGNFMFGFHDSEELGSRILAKIASKTGLTPSDL